jgi:hypothetical protein
MWRISFTLRQVSAMPSLPVVSPLPQSGDGPDRCPQAGVPLSGPGAITGPAAWRRAGGFAVATVSQARAASARVTCRYQASGCLKI